MFFPLVKDFPSDHDRVHSRALPSINQSINRIVLRSEIWQLESARIEQYQISFLAGLQCPGDIAPFEQTHSVDRRHFEDFLERYQTRARTGDSLQVCRQADFLQHVRVIVESAAVQAQRQWDTGPIKERQWRDTAA